MAEPQTQARTQPRAQSRELVAELPLFAAELFQPHRYKVLWGGRGAARSWTVARVLLVMAAQRPMRVLCARELQKSIQDSVHRLLSDQIKLLGLPGYEVTQREIRHANGSLFLFEGLRYNVTKIKSLEGIDVAWVEEAERVSKESWDVLIPTIRKAGSEIWVTFNPDQEDDPTYQRFIVHPPPDAWVAKVSWADNPWFPDELRQEKDYLYAVDPDAAAHVWGGECRAATDAQILRGKWRVEAFEPDDTYDGPYHGADFGLTHPNVLVRCWVAPGTLARSTGRLMIEYEAYKVGQDTDHIPEHWQREVPGCERYVIRGDAARPETISYLKRHGFPQITAAPKWQGSVEDGIAFLRQFEEIVIHPRCVHVAQEARLWSWKTDERTGDILPVPLDKHNHTWDAIRYALAPLIKQRPKSGVPDYASSASFTI